MSRDVNVYARKEATIPIDEILAQMRARGIPVDWKTDPFVEFFTGSHAPGAWTAGYFLPEGSTDTKSQISISTKAIEKGTAERLVAAYKDVITEPQREALFAARTLYQLSAGWVSNEERERILVNLADVLADLGDGLILDTQTNRFYDRTQYRNQFISLFGPKS